MPRLRALPILAVLGGLLLGPAPSAGQSVPPYVPSDVCPEPNNALANACYLGQPNAQGTTVAGLFHSPVDVDVYRFDVPASGAQAHVSLTDIWYEASLRLYDASRGVFIAESDRQGQAQGQLRAPEVIVTWLEPGSYAAFIAAGSDDWEHAEAYSYTLRVALGPRSAAPADAAPFPSSANGYQLTLSIEPSDPGPFSLMTFSATIVPPYTDLFDFSWTVDGQAFGDNAAVVQLGRPSSGAHTVMVIARGSRYYPDMTYPELPPTLGASGAFSVR
jgi:hypothetical protein